MARGQVSDRRGTGPARRLLAAAVLLPLVLLTASASTGASKAQPDKASLATAQRLVAAAAAARFEAPTRTAGVRPNVRRTSAACPESTVQGFVCLEIDVPLDYTGKTPGAIRLHADVLPAQGTPRGVMFLIAGGPGQGSAHVFNLAEPEAAALNRFLFPGYTLVAYDDRGTGDSGLLDCPDLQRAITADAQQSAAAACADSIGPTRSFYSTADHAEDLDAVRRALGAEKVALFGVSYGTKLAGAYALAHPGNVERLILDSVVAPDRADPYGADVLRSLPAILDAFCSDGGCRGVTNSFGADVAAVANQVAAKPIQGKVLRVGGSTVVQRLDGLQLISLVLDADLNPGIAAELPAVVKAARLGNTLPLLRLARIHEVTGVTPSGSLSFALYAATVCRDGPFPWLPDTSVADRKPVYQAALSALPAGTFGLFGNWAARFGNADFCLGWPSPAGGAALGAGPLPNVPVLAISGGFDMRTPTAGAVAVVARFPQGRLLVVPGVGHSTTTADPSGCAALAVRSWMQGGAVPNQCPRSKAIVPPVPALPAPGPARPKRPSSPAQTYSIAARTIRDAEAIWLTSAPATIAGLYGGQLVTTSGRSFKLVNYSIARGVGLSGRLRFTKIGLPLIFEGSVRVSGPGAASGVLGLAGTSLKGTLGGRIVGR